MVSLGGRPIHSRSGTFWVSTDSEEILHDSVNRRESLELSGRLEALVRGCGQASALQTVEPVTYRCGTRRVYQARSSGSERDTRARPHAVAPMNCVPEDSRRRSTCTGRTHSPRARADGHQTPSSTPCRPSAFTLLIVRSRAPDRAPRRDNDAVLVGGTTTRAPRAPAAP